MNPYACQVFGYERDEMIGQPMDEMISELGEAERGADLRVELHRAPDKRFRGFEQYLRKKDGGVVLIRWDISALRDADGNYGGVVGGCTALRESPDHRPALLDNQGILDA